MQNGVLLENSWIGSGSDNVTLNGGPSNPFIAANCINAARLHDNAGDGSTEYLNAAAAAKSGCANGEVMDSSKRQYLLDRGR